MNSELRNKLSYFIIGNDELASKITGLLNRRITTIINCSLKNIQLDKNIKYINIDISNINSNKISKENEILIIETINKLNEKNKCMIYSENKTQTVIIYCLILMKLFKIKFNELVSNNLFNVEILKDNMNIIKKLETDIFGNEEKMNNPNLAEVPVCTIINGSKSKIVIKQSKRKEDLEYIMLLIGNKINKEIVEEMLNKGMTIDVIVNDLFNLLS